MIVTVTMGVSTSAHRWTILQEDDLLWFIKAQLKLGREIHITPEKEDLSYGGKE